ncbi:threonylcarbamoyl-AMP synthase [Sporomusaceae bacterium FL31]|nr:threonylcarbamoyl-AMP synthase [Sporomusaceae bacterium FL31]GCE34080.1 threonylcarbamoyl-AMP synthase [Sporomusaceae bacterium]
MRTEYYHVDKDKPDASVLDHAAVILRRGGLVAFPTETVYGLGANGLDEQAVAGIYRAKGRPSDNPLILHIAGQDELAKLVQAVPTNARALMERFWPGPLTIIFKRSPIIPNAVTGGLDTVAIRMPDSLVARELIRLAGVPVAAPSANTSGRPSPTTAQAVLADLDDRIELIIDAGSSNIGLESTVIDCTTTVPTLLRPGGITLEMLIDVLGDIEIDPTLGGEQAIPKSPGMKYTHYAPNAPMIVLEGEVAPLIARLAAEIQHSLSAGKTVGAVVSGETAEQLQSEVIVASYGKRTSPADIAANLYEALRYFDAHPVDVIYAEGISENGLGLAVMNRLRKASGYHILKV